MRIKGDKIAFLFRRHFKFAYLVTRSCEAFYIGKKKGTRIVTEKVGYCVLTLQMFKPTAVVLYQSQPCWALKLPMMT